MPRVAPVYRAPAITPGFTVTTGIEYTDSVLLDAYAPAAADRPVIVLLHGGAFVGGARTELPYPMIACRFAAKGFAVFNADYTLTGGDPQAQFDDILALMTWVRANAEDYNGDPTRVTVLGVSAGGTLALMLATTGTDGTTRPEAVVGWSPASDMAVIHEYHPDECLAYLGVALEGNEALYAQWSPRQRITAECCPLRIVGSDNEDIITNNHLRVDEFTNMIEAAEAVGVPVTSKIFEGSCHGLFFDGFRGFFGANDVHATAAWITSTVGSIPALSGRSAPANRLAPSNRVAVS